MLLVGVACLVGCRGIMLVYRGDGAVSPCVVSLVWVGELDGGR